MRPRYQYIFVLSNFLIIWNHYMSLFLIDNQFTARYWVAALLVIGEVLSAHLARQKPASLILRQNATYSQKYINIQGAIMASMAWPRSNQASCNQYFDDDAHIFFSCSMLRRHHFSGAAILSLIAGSANDFLIISLRISQGHYDLPCICIWRRQITRPSHASTLWALLLAFASSMHNAIADNLGLQYIKGFKRQ